MTIEKQVAVWVCNIDIIICWIIEIAKGVGIFAGAALVIKAISIAIRKIKRR